MRAALAACGLAAAAFLLFALALRVAERDGVRRRAGVGQAPRPRAIGPTWLRSASPRAVVGASAVAGALGGFVVSGVPGGAVGAVALAAVPTMLRRRRRAREARLLEEQLSEAVGTVGAALRAGLSLRQALAYAADESEAPLSTSLREVVRHAELGVPLDVALQQWAAPDAAEEVRLVAAVLRMHRRTGGDLPSVLDRMVATLRARRSAAREVRSLTAQARLSGAVLGLLPVGFFLFLGLTSRSDLAAALSSSAGRTAVGMGLALQAAAFVWIRRLLRVT